MTEPASGAAAGVAGWKLIGGAAGAAGLGAVLVTIVVMLMTPPRSAREWAVGLISTVVGSIAGGAAVVQHFGLQAWMHSIPGSVAVLGVVFACGLPAWAIVRWIFNYIEKKRAAGIDEVLADGKKVLP